MDGFHLFLNQPDLHSKVMLRLKALKRWGSGLRSKRLSQRRVHNFSYPGKTGEIAEVVDSIAVASDPSPVIIHTGTNNRPSESAESCVTEIKKLALKVKNKFPTSSVGISGIVYREDINVDSKRVKVNEMFQPWQKIITLFTLTIQLLTPRH